MPALILVLLTGLVFGTGIALSGMINPAKVLNFFDVAGTWDPSLAFVMAGALIVTAIGYRFVLKSPRPLFDGQFHLPARKDIDMPLLAGSTLFGIGWGIAGFCPGGSIPALGLMQTDAVIFVAAMIAGIAITRAARQAMSRSPSVQKAAS
ncbi:YeeE/YedE family protein [Pannonibacter phragmitetus]|uniref:YeeE/YedE family protein n=1 Tax=Pannonibacter phragmitetus TaxID=121719 RepID=UPI000B979AE8|nr:YeeE/YedE family protein [Pannonibacter phragmitetus]